ncbi:ATP-binding protein [Cytobacillus massiliigabonensis]|uniref:AAA family ATPase n=1 Tax=Cytobacillus massiliigabonensis TaxID=1871011 RepID=UPI000C84C456|nr:AAA family ATPase [Cytobacillus massiliigabonensis]
MDRFLIMTVGVTHSGKTTFAKLLEKRMTNSIVVDQDLQEEFLQKNYSILIPEFGPKNLKYALTQTIVDFAINKTNLHIILCNSNRQKNPRLYLLNLFKKERFKTIIVNFDFPLDKIKCRIVNSDRDLTILRNVKNYDEILNIQLNQTEKEDFIRPTEEEANYLFTITKECEVQSVVESIINIINGIKS